jgi:hypothetical protein
MASKIDPQRFPGIEMICCIYRSARAVGGTDRPILLKGCGALNRGLVGAGGFEDVVSAAVTGDRAFLGGACGGIVCPKVLDDVVFD